MYIFFFKQKTAYEMRISDWSSDVCSSDLGGDVSLTSTDGSIVNQTLVSTTGREGNMTTDFGKSAGIESTGALSLDAKKDIAVSGATVTAGGDASLKAGQDFTFTSIQDKTSTSQKNENGSRTTTTITERGR